MATMTHEEVEEKMLDMLEEVCGDEEVRDLSLIHISEPTRH